MKKNLFMMLSLLVAALSVHAKDGVTVVEATVSKGNAGTISVALDNDSYTFTAFTFKLTLPDGLSFKRDSDGKPTKTGGDRYGDHGLGSGGSGQTGIFSAFSLTSAPITGTSGVILNIDILADASLEVGSTLTAKLSELTFTTVNAEEVNFDDIEFTVTVTDSRVLLDETSTEMPVAAEGANVLVKRTFKADTWSTFCLPFAMTGTQTTAAFGEDVQIADFAGYELTTDDNENIVGITVKFNGVDATSGIEANHPYIIRTSAAISEFTADGVDIDPEEEPVVAAVKRTRRQWSELIGTYVAETEVPEKTLFLNANKFWYSTGATKMKGYRAYFDFYDVLTSVDEAYANVRFIVEDATGIHEIDGTGLIDEGIVEGYYTLDGRKLNDKPTEKGVYIVNGKKILNK